MLPQQLSRQGIGKGAVLKKVQYIGLYMTEEIKYVHTTCI